MNSLLEPLRKNLFQNSEFEVVSLQWTSENVTEVHSHGFSQCLVQIVEGEFENHLLLGSKKEIVKLKAGDMLDTPLGSRHQLICLSERGQTLHVYSPPLKDQENLHFNATKASELKPKLRLGEGPSLNWAQIKSLMAEVQEASVATHSPLFMNQLFSGVPAQTHLAETVITRTKTTLATREASPVLSQIEREVVEALGIQIGWKKDLCDGVCVPGGSSANFMALHLARHRQFPEFKKTGILPQRAQIFVSKDAHYSLQKACNVLGFGTENLVTLPVDERGRMDSRALDEALGQCKANGFIPLLVCATAGTTVYGAFDPLGPISSVCEKYKVWLHVDAAWGAPALFSKKLASQIQGIHKADSVTFDAHKFYGAGLTCSFFLTQHQGLLLKANDVSGADYLFHNSEQNENLDLGKISWQCGRRADALSFWTIWKSLGTQGLSKHIDRQLQVIEEITPWIDDQPRLQWVRKPEFLNLCVRVLPPEDSNQDPKTWSKATQAWEGPRSPGDSRPGWGQECGR